jgi:succinate dehydrogenase / fumarate reductase cytochrome b subunit
MSSAAPTKRDHPTNTLPVRKGVFGWLKPFFTSSVGMKATTAVTGFLLTGFVIVHLIGNLKVFAGPDAINGYAQFLKDLGPWLWLARGGLLAVFVLHVVLAMKLAWRARAARPVRYQYPATIQATRASLTMPWTGQAIFVFALFHLAHFTFAWVETIPAKSLITGKMKQSNYLDLVDAQGRHDVYTMVVKGFENPYVSAIYVIAMAILFVHLKHGIGSMFQSLGLNTPRVQPFIRALALTVAGLITLGNVGIVAFVWAGQVPVDPVPLTKAGADDLPTPQPPGPPAK